MIIYGRGKAAIKYHEFILILKHISRILHDEKQKKL
jgi:hypothetical protein